MVHVPSAGQDDTGRGSGEIASHTKPVPQIAITQEEEEPALPRKRYTYEATVSPPADAPITSPLDAQLRRQGYGDAGLTADTAYNPFATQIDRSQSQRDVPAAPARSNSILSRLTSLRHTFSRRDRYAEIEEDEDASQHKQQRRLRDMDEEEAEGENIPYDVSAFGGPIPLRSLSSQSGHKKSASSADIDLDPTAAGLMAEFHSLENVPRRTGTIGGGLDNVLKTSYNDVARAATTKRVKRGLTTNVRRGLTTNVRRGLTTKHKREASDSEARDMALEKAKETGGIIEVIEYPVDYSQFEGAPGEALQNVESKGETKSYYFPPDPDMPNWRPFSMKWPYLLILTLLAILFGVIQEWLCRLSIWRAQHDDGLIKFYKASDVSLPVYFAWKYMPTIVLVSYGIMWQVTDFEVKRLEPFHQLSKQEGATAAESLNMDYLTFLQYFVPFKAIRYKQWGVLWSSVGTLLATSLLPVLQSAAVNMEPDAGQRRANEPKFVRMDPGWSRATTVFCFIVALMGVFLIYLLERRKSGLLSDPKGIAGVAAMATRSHILNDFRNLDYASNHKIHKQIRERRYILHKSALWQGEFIRHPAPAEEQKPEHPHPPMLRLQYGIPYISSLMLFMILIPVFMFVPKANVVTEKAQWLLITLATLLKLVWSTMEMDVRMVQPWYLLSRRRAPARTLTLDYMGTMPGVICVKAFVNKHYLVAVVGLCSLLTEVLTVCVSSFSVDGSKFVPGVVDTATDQNGEANSQETFTSFWVSFVLSMAILSIMCLVAAGVYVRRRHKFVPREPGTIASVLAFIHQSRMLTDFVDTETYNSRKMTTFLEGQGKTYGLGWFNGRDGEDHCGVDEEPLLADYKWGYDWRKGRITSVAIGTWEMY